MIRARFLALAAGGALGLPAIAAAADPPTGKTLTVFAAASLREAFTAIGSQFGSTQHVDVRYNFAAADMLANQIAQGAAADVFASANQAWATYLEEKHALGSVPQVFALNRLASRAARTRLFGSAAAG